MVLVDTGPLVALHDERDALHARAVRELARLRGPKWVGVPVLVETTQLLNDPQHRRRLEASISRQLFSLAMPEHWSRAIGRSLQWLNRYAEHSPDFVDAFLVTWSEEDHASRIWTFDTEFRDVWRTSTGQRPKLALQLPHTHA